MKKKTSLISANESREQKIRCSINRIFTKSYFFLYIKKKQVLISRKKLTFNLNNVSLDNNTKMLRTKRTDLVIFRFTGTYNGGGNPSAT